MRGVVVGVGVRNGTSVRGKACGGRSDVVVRTRMRLGA